MFDRENKIRFYYYPGQELHIDYRCGKCNRKLEITDLVHVLCKYGTTDCPDNLYQAWKILRMGTAEYADNKGQPELEHSILTSALAAIVSAQTKEGVSP